MAVNGTKQEMNNKIAQLVTDAFDAVMEIDGKLLDTTQVRGMDWSKHGLDYDKLFASLKTTGFQATNFSLAVDEINKMIASKLKPIDLTPDTVTAAAKEFKSMSANLPVNSLKK